MDDSGSISLPLTIKGLLERHYYAGEVIGSLTVKDLVEKSTDGTNTYLIKICRRFESQLRKNDTGIKQLFPTQSKPGYSEGYFLNPVDPGFLCGIEIEQYPVNDDTRVFVQYGLHTQPQNRYYTSQVCYDGSLSKSLTQFTQSFFSSYVSDYVVTTEFSFFRLLLSTPTPADNKFIDGDRKLPIRAWYYNYFSITKNDQGGIKKIRLHFPPQTFTTSLIDIE